MADNNQGVAEGNAPRHLGANAPSMTAPPGVLGRIHSVAGGVAQQRGVLEAAYQASRQATQAAAGRVLELDAALAAAAANQAVLQSKRDSLDSVGRRKLRASIWRALSRDQLGLEYHDGRQPRSLAWVVSVTANHARQWTADVWFPVEPSRRTDGAPGLVWQTGVDACLRAAAVLKCAPDAVLLVSANGIAGIRLQPPAETARDALTSALTHALDQARVQAVELHERRLEVSVVWLDLDVELDGGSTPIETFDEDELDTLVGGVVR